MSDILVGRIVDAHGIRGAVKLLSFTAVPADIATYGALHAADGRSFNILRMKPAKDVFIADLKGVTDRNVAEALKGTDLFVARSSLPAAKAGEIYLHDLVGKAVVSQGKALGIVAGFQNFGAGDLMELEDGQLIPVAFLGEAAEAVTVNLPEGFLDPDDTPAGQGGRP